MLHSPIFYWIGIATSIVIVLFILSLVYYGLVIPSLRAISMTFFLFTWHLRNTKPMTRKVFFKMVREIPGSIWDYFCEFFRNYHSSTVYHLKDGSTWTGILEWNYVKKSDN